MRQSGLNRAISLAVLSSLSLATAGRGDEATPLPIPRYVSMRHSGVNVHAGPGVQYPVSWIFTRQNLPVEITKEFANWRKIRDVDGSEGWVTSAALQGKRFVIVQATLGQLRAGPADTSGLVAEVEPGVVARLDNCPPDTIEWCRIESNDVRGWIERKQLWGVYPDEVYPSP